LYDARSAHNANKPAPRLQEFLDPTFVLECRGKSGMEGMACLTETCVNLLQNWNLRVNCDVSPRKSIQFSKSLK